MRARTHGISHQEGYGHRLTHGLPVLLSALCVLVVAGCGDAGRGRYGQTTLKMAILPVHTGQAMNSSFTPLLEYLSSETGYEVQYISSQTYEGFGAAVEGSGAAVVFCDPLVFLTLQRTQGAVALAAGIATDGGRTWPGVVAVAASSPVTGLSQLRGASVACVARRSADGYVSQALALRQAGIELPGDARLVGCAPLEAAAALVRTGRVAAAFLGPQAMTGDDSAGLRVVSAGAPVPTWVCAALGGADPEAATRVAAALLRLSPTNPEHARILSRLGFARFDRPAATDLEALGRQATSLAIPY
jgi:ABC-type phosphate/phosphonate transport system substrate-binding protein